MLKWVAGFPVNESNKLKILGVQNESQCVAVVHIDPIAYLSFSYCETKTNIAICKSKVPKCGQIEEENGVIRKLQNNYGQSEELYCKSGYFFLDRSLSKSILCNYNTETQSLE